MPYLYGSCYCDYAQCRIGVETQSAAEPVILSGFAVVQPGVMLRRLWSTAQHSTNWEKDPLLGERQQRSLLTKP